MKWIYRAGRFLADIIHPNRCAVCGEFLPFDDCICTKCEKDLEYIEKGCCERCGHRICLCEKEEIYYDRCFAFVYYENSVKTAVLTLKSGYSVNLARYFADHACRYLADNGLLGEIDIITAVPITKDKRRETGYNHAYMYAKMIHRLCDIPSSDRLLVKKDTDLVQHELSAKERKEKAFGAFEFCGSVSEVIGKTVLLCDDIITTGSTMNACAKALKDAGAKRVICAAIASTAYERP